MGRFTLRSSLSTILREQQQQIENKAKSVGLDFFPVMFETLSYDQMNEVASFGGFPIRYPHWRFGMEYEHIAKSYEYGLSKIYELVINNNPSVAYLLDGNSLVDQKLVMAHVYAHVDFFKNNMEFCVTDQGRDRSSEQVIRKWIDTMANHGATVRRWAHRLGIEKVEELIDTCLSLENLIDTKKSYRLERHPLFENAEESSQPIEPSLIRYDREYMESFINPQEFVEAQRRKAVQERETPLRVPSEPTRDVLGFLTEHAPLERWEREIIDIIRIEALYFRPQIQTKIMNEGWATYWHSRLMTEGLCTGEEIVDYADRCAGVLAPHPNQLNPYKLGIELFRHIEDRWNRGRFGKEWDECDDLETRLHWDRRTHLGHEQIFRVRALYNDLTFIDEFLTPDFVADQKLYTFGYNSRNDRWEVESKRFESVKERLLSMLTNGGHPVIEITDSNHNNRGELLLQHVHYGVDLRLDWAQYALRSLERIWKRPVEIRTIIDTEANHLRCDQGKYTQIKNN